MKEIVQLTTKELIAEPWRRAIKWDITHEEALRRVEDETFAFDPRLSYESTGYRPITEDQGLDFDPTPFRETGQNRMKTGSYSGLFYGSRQYGAWWDEQIYRSKNGFVSNNYRVTPDHYFFLNFYTMLVAKEGQKAGGGRVAEHPSFWSVHYEWFHYIELAEILGYDCVGLKSRGVGFSEVGASLGVRPYTTNKDYSTLYVASYEPFLTGKGIIQKCWKQLDWLNQNTEGAMRRVRQGKNDDLMKKAVKKNKQGEESGHGAIISGQVVDKPDKLRGDRTERVIFEESGSNHCLLDTYSVSKALVEINSIRLGTRVVFGTGGDTTVVEGKRGSVSGLHGLEKMFLQPRTYSALPYVHNYNQSKQYVETGYFVPAWRTVIIAMDHRGVVDEKKAKAFYQKKRDAVLADPESYLKECSEFCFTYEEALSRKGSNRFDQVKLADQRLEIEVHKRTPTPAIGFMEWKWADNKVNTTIVGVKFIPHEKGNVEIVEEPLLEDGMHIPSLYVAGIDSIDVGADESIVGNKGSKFCIVVKKRSYGMGGNQYVCKYIHRPDDVRKAYETAAMILMWYKCQANVEATRVGIIGYFREKGWIHLLMRRPKYALQGQSTNQMATQLYGTQSSKPMIEYGIDLVRDYVFDYCKQILFLDMVIELQEYSDEMKGKYDIVAALQMCEIGDQEMMGIVPKKIEVEVQEDVGYYTDSKGYKRWGVIEK